MSVWQNEDSFFSDLNGLSDFHVSSMYATPDKSQPSTRFSHENNIWYDSDHESADICETSQITEDHYEILKNVQMQVRSTVGNCYNNDAIESYYKTLKQEAEVAQESDIISQILKSTPNPIADTPKEPTKPTGAKSKSVAENIMASLKNLQLSEKSDNLQVKNDDTTTSSSNSAEISPKRDLLNASPNQNFKNKRRNGYNKMKSFDKKLRARDSVVRNFHSSDKKLDINCRTNFPEL